jgi:branched-chain amino acid transport system substrate-binding protein
MHLSTTLRRTAAAVALAFAAGLAGAQGNVPIKVGFMLPATGTYANLGTMIENGFKLHVAEQGGKLGGREVQYFKVDDESDPAKASDNV